ncbi:BamA/TamA family outer membrane protein [candidate division GN15 bacterium]|nr:BamA/TamA family outer membrane protein [candidate division GN15 bacterium]
MSGFFDDFPLWQSVFVDVGNGFARIEEVRWDYVAVAYGTGVQVVSPAGPIRIDYARAWDPRIEESRQRWHFTILYAF